MATTTVAPRPPLARRTTVALKLLMAVTGLIFALFVLVHMYGNLKVLSGQQAFNDYAEHLRTIGEPMLPYAGLLWVVRIVLILAVIGHVDAAIMLWTRAGAARSTKYAMAKQVMTSKVMRWGGAFLLLFIIWHLIQFTIPKVAVNPDAQGPDVLNNPYLLVVSSFQVWWVTLIYVLAMIALGMHLHHGVYSACQTLGWTGNAAKRGRAKALAGLVAAIVVVGFLIPPLSIQFGLVK